MTAARLAVFALMGFWVKVAAVASCSCPVPLRSSGLSGFGLAALSVHRAAGRSPGPRRDEVSAALVLTPVTSSTAAWNPGTEAQLAVASVSSTHGSGFQGQWRCKERKPFLPFFNHLWLFPD